jgi:tRNA A22 N-methylase
MKIEEIIDTIEELGISLREWLTENNYTMEDFKKAIELLSEVGYHINLEFVRPEEEEVYWELILTKGTTVAKITITPKAVKAAFRRVVTVKDKDTLVEHEDNFSSIPEAAEHIKELITTMGD